MLPLSKLKKVALVWFFRCTRCSNRSFSFLVYVIFVRYNFYISNNLNCFSSSVIIVVLRKHFPEVVLCVFLVCMGRYDNYLFKKI